MAPLVRGVYGHELVYTNSCTRKDFEGLLNTNLGTHIVTIVEELATSGWEQSWAGAWIAMQCLGQMPRQR